MQHMPSQQHYEGTSPMAAMGMGPMGEVGAYGLHGGGGASGAGAGYHLAHALPPHHSHHAPAPPHHAPPPPTHHPHGPGAAPAPAPFHHHGMPLAPHHAPPPAPPPPPPAPAPHAHAPPFPDSATLAKMSYTSMLNLVNSNAAVTAAMSAMGATMAGAPPGAMGGQGAPVAGPQGTNAPPHAPGGVQGAPQGTHGGPAPAPAQPPPQGHGPAPPQGPAHPPGPAQGPPTVSVSRRDLFELIHANNANRDALVEHVLSVLRLNAAPHHVQQYVKQEVSRFYSRCIARWKHSRRMKERFLRMNAYWLAIELRAEDLVAAADRHLANAETRSFLAPQLEEEEEPPPPPPRAEDPPINLKPRDYGERSLRALGPMSFSEPPMPRLPRPRAPGAAAAAAAAAGRKLMSRRNAPVSYTPEQALDRLIVRARLKKRQYEIMRDYALSINCYIYPSFQAIQKVIRERAAAGIQVPCDPEAEGEADSE